MRTAFTALLIIGLLPCLVTTLSHRVKQLTGSELSKALSQNAYTLLYVYSSSCQYCRQFTPIFQEVSMFDSFSNIHFAKIDSVYSDVLAPYKVSSYPTVMLFWKHFPTKPIYFRAERTASELQKFLQESAGRDNSKQIQDPDNLSPYRRIEEKIVVYYGTPESQNYEYLKLACNRDRFFTWTVVNSAEERIIIGKKTLQGANLTFEQVQAAIAREFSRVHELGEEPWMRMFLNKQLGLIYINTEGNKKVPSLLEEMAKDYPEVVFMNLSPDHPQYKEALRVFTVHDQENIIAVDRLADAVFVAEAPYSQQSVADFIAKVKKYEWPVYKKSERTEKPEKLTRQNYHTKMETPKDTVLFLYRRHQKISKGFVELFNSLRDGLSGNKNIDFLRCDVSSNEIEEYLGFLVEKTPRIIFYRNRMKDKPIYFTGGKLSRESVIEFIMENTTFDWEEEWGQL